MMVWGLPKKCEECEHFRNVYERSGKYAYESVCIEDSLAIIKVNPDDKACPKWELVDI